MWFLKRKMVLGSDNINEDEWLYWNVQGCNLAVLGCTELYWAVMACSGLYWAILGLHISHIWHILQSFYILQI